MCESHLLRILVLGSLLVCGCAPGEESAAGGRPVIPEPIAAPAPPPRPEAAIRGGLQARVEGALRQIRERDLLKTNSFWTIFHGILGVGSDAELLDPLTRKKVNAIDWIARGGEVRGLRFIPTAHGLDVQTGPVFVGQGHQDQFIAEMAQWGMPIDCAFLVHGKEYTFGDFVRHAQMRASVKGSQELSWAILIIAQYLGTDVEWTNDAREHLHFDDVVRYELNQPIEDGACGGTHRLFGLTWAWHYHLKRGGKTEGVWKDVAAKLEVYQKKAKQYQNGDGAFSTRYLAGPGNAKDMQLRIGTTGHVLEWLALSLSDEELREPWVQDAAAALSLMILDSSGRPIESGALYHAAHGLHLYHARMFGRSSVTSPELLVVSRKSSSP
jgi:hypothetical protein